MNPYLKLASHFAELLSFKIQNLYFTMKNILIRAGFYPGLSDPHRFQYGTGFMEPTSVVRILTKLSRSFLFYFSNYSFVTIARKEPKAFLKSLRQCCKTGMFILNPNFSIPDPG
jgi:hypothetical protein